MNRGLFQIHPGFTIIEMVTVMLLFSIIMVTVGFVVGDNQQAWGSLHSRAFNKTIEEGYLAGTTFETICRKSSRQSCSISQNGSSCTLYYYNDLGAESPDHYAKFHLNNGTLYVERGSSDTVFFDMPLAENIEDIFFSQDGDAVKMRMTLRNGDETMLFVYSATRHAE